MTIENDRRGGPGPLRPGSYAGRVTGEGTAEPAPGDPPGVIGRVVRPELGRLAELSALVGFAVVAPVLGSFGESTETFVAVGARPSDIVSFALVVAFVPLLVLGLLVTATRAFGDGVRGVVQHGMAGLLAGVVAVTLVRQLSVGTALQFLAAVAVGAAAVLVHRRWRPARLFLRYASPAPVFFLLIFLFASPVSGLVNPADVEVDQTGSGGSAPVVMIVLDELPTLSLVAGGSIDRELFPNLARLGDQSTWYRDNTTVGSRTAIALPAIVTGRYPGTGAEVPAVLDNFPDNIITLMAKTHEVHATEWSTQFCPTSLCPPGPVDLTDEAQALLRKGADQRSAALPALVDEARSLWWQQAWPGASDESSTYEVAGARGPGEAARPGLEFLSGLRKPSGDRPTFDYLHAPLPHQPWTLLPSGNTYDAPHPAVGAEFTAWADDDQGAQFAKAAQVRNRLQLQWTDRLVGGIIDRLQELGRWDESVVVLTADHGISFTKGTPLRSLVAGDQTAISWTPLLVKAPGQQTGSVDDTNAMTVDVLPTIAELAGIEVPWEIDGRSLISDPRRDEKKVSETKDTDEFTTQVAANRVEIDADGLGAIKAARPTVDDGDPVRVWRAGRHGDLLGRRVEDVGVCTGGRAPTGSYRPPPTWDDYTRGTLPAGAPVPIWHEGTVDRDTPIDIAAVVEDTVVAWSPSRLADGANRFGLLLTEPLIEGAASAPTIYQVDGDCLRPLDT